MTPQTDVALAPLCTMGVGGPARWFAEAPTESAIVDSLRWAEAHGIDVQILGGGSNVVVADEGVNALVLHIQVRGIEYARQSEQVRYDVGAGEPWDPFVAMTVDDACAGLECLSGIPGLVGGTPVQNVGAYGQDVSGSVVRVRVIDRTTMRPQEWSNADCAFGYRSSRLKREDVDKFIVSRVEFGLHEGAPATVRYADLVKHFAGASEPLLSDVRQAVLAIRRRKGMVIEESNPANHSCGSFFVNPVVSTADLERIAAICAPVPVPHYVVDAISAKIPAAWLIERAGFIKGTMRGAVGISPFQSQAIVNLGGASAADVVALACDVKRAVWDTFRVALLPEPVFVGFRPSPELRFLNPESQISNSK